MTYADAMRDYGSDKPDLRVPLKLTELTDLMKTVDFKVFRAAADLPNGRVAALRVPGGGTLTRKEIDDYTPFVAIYGAKGLAYIKVNDAVEGERGRPAVADREVPVRGRAARDPCAHRRADRRPDLLRRRPREGRQRRARRAAREGRPRARLRGKRMEAAVGRRLSDVRVRRARRRAGPRAIIRSPRRRTATRTASRPTRATRSPRPTTSC